MSNDLFERLPLGRSLSLLAKTYFGALTKKLEHLEVERYYSILIFIEESGKGCSQQYICDHLKIDKVSMVRILDYLIKKKFIKKVQNPKDRREYFIELTPKAEKTMPEIHREIKNLNDVAFKGLSREKQKEFYRNMCLIYDNVETLPAHKIFVNYKKANKEKK
ncbi:MAG: MarR family transcriptional regulator [Bacteroidota bacterium]|jgi:DNA-binding MarR family transcriptional regulator|nr:MarR family transcriptional regulator [Bacteroidota bacterium]